MSGSIVLISGLGLVMLIGSLVLFLKSRQLKKNISVREKEMERKMYELAILKELGDRAGYSLDIHKIIDIITGSLKQFIDYSVVSYMLVEPEKIIFKAEVEKAVSKNFIEEVKERMVNSLSALLNSKVDKNYIDETMSGVVLIEGIETTVKSFFNIPLVIGEKIVGVLTVAHTQAGLYQAEDMTILYKLTQQASKAVTKLKEVVAMEQGKLKAMVASMAEGVVMTDNEYRVVVVNPALKMAVGLEEKGEVSIFDLIDKLGGKFDIRGKLEESVKLDKVILIKEVFINNRFFKIFVSPVKSDLPQTAGKILGGVVIFHDFTAEKETEKIREDFTSMMVHDLRTPLDGIEKLTRIMKQEPMGGDEQKYFKYVDLINDNSSRMLTLVNDLLSVAKMDSGKFELEQVAVNLRSVIKKSLALFEGVAKKAKIKLVKNIQKEVPLKLVLDQTKIMQVLNNLVSNAIKFTNENGTVKLNVFLHQAGKNIKAEAATVGLVLDQIMEQKKFRDMKESVVFVISDDGVGISSENQAKLFSKFRQLRTSGIKGERRGTGLGLVIAKGIVEAHGGRIGLESAEGEGSKFYFSIPLKVKEADLIKTNL